MKACVEEVRVRIVRAVVEKGMARADAAELFGVSVPSVGRLVRTHQAGGSLTPRVSTGRPRKLRLAEHVAVLREHLERANRTWNWPCVVSICTRLKALP